jgi:hydrogenase expression/formation protein HypC
MCLAIPGKILTIDAATPLRMATVSFGGIRKSVCIDWTPEARVGDYVIVHAGCAISTMDEREAQKTLELFDVIDETSTGKGASP